MSTEKWYLTFKGEYGPLVAFIHEDRLTEHEIRTVAEELTHKHPEKRFNAIRRRGLNLKDALHLEDQCHETKLHAGHFPITQFGRSREDASIRERRNIYWAAEVLIDKVIELKAGPGVKEPADLPTSSGGSAEEGLSVHASPEASWRKPTEPTRPEFPEKIAKVWFKLKGRRELFRMAEAREIALKRIGGPQGRKFIADQDEVGSHNPQALDDCRGDARSEQ